jgi:hypothetical protein
VRRFLRLFRQASKESSQIGSELLPNERLSRYIFSRSQFTPGRVKPRAFEPPPDLKLSVFRIDGLDEKKIWEIGLHDARGPSNRTLHARGDVTVAIVKGVSLHARREEPPPRHAVINGWPASKDHRMSLAQRLAAHSTLAIYSAGS